MSESGFNSSYQFSFQNAQLSYDLNSNGIGSPCLGCDYLPFIGFTGFTDFTAANSADFTAFMTELNDGVDVFLHPFPGLYSSNNTIVAGGGPVKLESEWLPVPFGTNPDLVRRWILINNLTLRPSAGQIDYTVMTQWEFWSVGSGEAPGPTPVALVPPTPIPEPASMLLLGGSLIGIFGSRRVLFRSLDSASRSNSDACA